MNVNAAGHMPAHHHRRPAPSAEAVPATTTTTAPAADDTAPVDGTTPADEPAPTDRRGGSDTPFTHALFRGEGKKLGILKRLPTPEDVAAEQAAAGLPADGVVGDGTAVEGDGTTDAVDGTVPADGAPVAEGDVVADEGVGEEAGGIVIDGSSLAIGTDGGADSSIVDELAEAVAAAAEAAAEEAAAEQTAPEEVVVVDDAVA